MAAGLDERGEAAAAGELGMEVKTVGLLAFVTQRLSVVCGPSRRPQGRKGGSLSLIRERGAG